MRVIAVTIAMLFVGLGAPSHAANAPIVEKVAAAIRGGQPLDKLDGEPVISASTIKANKDLIGCASKIVPGWSPEFPSIEFTCSSRSEQYLRIVSLRVSEGKVEYLSTSPLRMAIGPTSEALGRSYIPFQDGLFARFMRSVKSGGDLTIEGLIPLTTDQLNALRQLAGYDWEYLTTEYGLGAYLHVKDRIAVVSMKFDSKDRPILVEINLDAPHPMVPVGSNHHHD